MGKKINALLTAPILAFSLLPMNVPSVWAADPAGLSVCPTSGSAGVIPPANASCYVFTPATAGAEASGAGATTNNYALAPSGGGNGNLVVYLNGSYGSPACCIASPDTNVYTAAVTQGLHVLALSYDSSAAIGQLCDEDDCFLPSRLTVLTGVYQAGAATELRTITPTEGVYSRLALALAYLAQNKPEDGWGNFLQQNADPQNDPANAVIWPKVIASGHSQGGGHAALLGKLWPVRRIVAFSSPCDADPTGAPATWLTYDAATWVTNPSTSAGELSAPTSFGTDGHPDGGDEVCPVHMAALGAMTVPSADTDNNAFVCKAGSLGAHGSAIRCVENYQQWLGLYQLN